MRIPKRATKGEMCRKREKKRENLGCKYKGKMRKKKERQEKNGRGWGVSFVKISR